MMNLQYKFYLSRLIVTKLMQKNSPTILFSPPPLFSIAHTVFMNAEIKV